MKILVVSVGSIARRHIKNLKATDADCRIAVLRQHSKDADLGDIMSLVDHVFFEEQDALDWKPDVVFITNPSSLHIKIAMVFANAGCHLFIEKPLSDSLKGIEELQKVVQDKALIVMVGYVLRFLKPFQIIKAAIEEGKIGDILAIRATVGCYLPDWRPQTDYRKNVTARKNLGGGVITELSHELDYVRWMVGEIKDVSAFVDTVSDFEIDVEDVAEINLRFERNAIGNVHLDMVDHARNRFCRIMGSDGTILWDSEGTHMVKLITRDNQEGLYLWNPESFDYNQMYIDELKEFFDCLKSKRQPSLDIGEGKRVVELILAVKRSAKEGRVVSV